MKKRFESVAEALEAVDSKNALWRVWEAISEQAGDYPYRPILFSIQVRPVDGKERMEIDEVEEDELIEYILEGIKEMAYEAQRASNYKEDKARATDIKKALRELEGKNLPELELRLVPTLTPRTRSR